MNQNQAKDLSKAEAQLRLVHPAPAYSKKEKYVSAKTVKEAEALVAAFMRRAEADDGISYKERFLGTPALFEYLSSLVDEERQRNMRLELSEKYGRQFSGGLWHAGAADDFRLCMFNGKLLLFDGQHRCAGLRSAGACMEVWLMFTKDSYAFVAIDQGGTRNVADALKMRGLGNIQKAAISAGITEKLDFIPVYRGTTAERDAEICEYDQFGKLISLPKGKVGELASLLRTMRFDPPGIALARAWHVAFAKGETDILGVHEPTLKKAVHVWTGEEKITNGDLRTKTVSYITGFFYQAFYEGRIGRWKTPSSYPNSEYPISMEYAKKEITTDNRRMSVNTEILSKLRGTK